MFVARTFVYQVKNTNNYDVVVNIIEYLKNTEIQYEKILFKFSCYEFRGKRDSKGFKYLNSRNEIVPYKSIHDYDESGMKKIIFSNYKLEENYVKDDVVLDIIKNIGNDTTLKNLPLTPESIKTAIGEILTVSIDDGVVFEMGTISPIREDDIYGDAS